MMTILMCFVHSSKFRDIQMQTHTLIIWLRWIWRFLSWTYSDISSYMKMKWGKNFFSRFSHAPHCIFMCAKRIRHDKTVFFVSLDATKKKRKGEKKRFKFFLWSIQFVILWCRAHFWCGFPHFVIYCVVLFCCSLILHTHTSETIHVVA